MDGLVPVVRNLGGQNLWVGAAVAVALLVALGAENLRNGTVPRIPALTVVAAGVAAGVTLALSYCGKEPDMVGKVVALVIALLLGVGAVAAVWIAPRARAAQGSVIAAAVVGFSVPSWLGMPDAPHLDYYDWPSIALLGVKYVIVPKTSVEYLDAFARNGFARVHDSLFTVVFENPHVMPRAFAVDLGRQQGGDDLRLPSDVTRPHHARDDRQYRNAYVEITGTADRAVLRT